MKSLHFILLFAFCLGVKAREASMWAPKCNANAPDYPNALQELNVAEWNLADCVLDIMKSPESDNGNNDPQKFCTADGLQTSRECFENYSQKLSRCLSTDEKFMEDMIMSTYTNIMEDMCSGDNLEELEAFIGKLHLHRGHAKSEAFYKIVDDCRQHADIYKMIKGDDGFIFEQKNICSDLENMKHCMLTEFPKGVLLELTDSLKKIFSPIVRWCEQHE